MANLHASGENSQNLDTQEYSIDSLLEEFGSDDIDTDNLSLDDILQEEELHDMEPANPTKSEPISGPADDAVRISSSVPSRLSDPDFPNRPKRMFRRKRRFVRQKTRLRTRASLLRLPKRQRTHLPQRCPRKILWIPVLKLPQPMRMMRF